MVYRALNIVFGCWLFLSAFLWPHSAAQFWNALLSGLLVASVAVLALETVPRARVVNTVLGAWLVVSSFLLPGLAELTVWNHVLVGVVVFGVSQLPGFQGMGGSRGPLLANRGPTG
jgi:hypothetical protein